MDGIEEVMRATLDNLRSVMSEDNIIGKPIVCADGCTILPVSKVSFGFVVGGGEYNESSPKVRKEAFPHANASGGGITITPMGFLLCGKEKRFVGTDKTTENKWVEFAKAAMNTIKKDDE